jgi:hypothetical protein
MWKTFGDAFISGVRIANEATSCSGVLLLRIDLSRSARHSTKNSGVMFER